MPTSVRLDPRSEALVRRLARAKRLSKSAVIREAILRFADETPEAVNGGPFDAIADLIGIASGGPSDLSRRSSAAFRERLLAKRRR
jgi:hypothetical protein